MNTKKVIAALVAFTAAATLGACTNPSKEIAPSKDKTPAPNAQPTTPAPAPTTPAPAPTTPAPSTPAPTNPVSPRVPVSPAPTTPQLGQGSGFTYGYTIIDSRNTASDGNYGYNSPDNTVSADTSHAAAQARFAAAQAALLDANNALTDAQNKLSAAQDAETAAQGALADAKVKEADAKAALDAAMQANPAGPWPT